MPLDSDEQASEKVKIVSETAQKCGFETHFPTYNKDLAEFDLQSTIKDLKNAQIVLADLSFERPSCYYELGVAEALGANIFLIAANGTDIHQSTHRATILFYDNFDHLKIVVYRILSKVKKCGRKK